MMFGPLYFVINRWWEPPAMKQPGRERRSRYRTRGGVPGMQGRSRYRSRDGTVGRMRNCRSHTGMFRRTKFRRTEKGAWQRHQKIRRTWKTQMEATLCKKSKVLYQIRLRPWLQVLKQRAAVIRELNTRNAKQERPENVWRTPKPPDPPNLPPEWNEGTKGDLYERTSPKHPHEEGRKMTNGMYTRCTEILCAETPLDSDATPHDPSDAHPLIQLLHTDGFLCSATKFETLDAWFEFIWDTGASRSVTFDKNDFVTPIRKSELTSIAGISKGLSVEGEGEIEWLVYDDKNRPFLFRHTALYIPTCNKRLLSCQSFSDFCGDETGSLYEFVLRSHLGYMRVQACTDSVSTKQILPSVTCRIDPGRNLPVCRGVCLGQNQKHANSKQDLLCAEAHLCVTDESNQNLSGAQKHLLQWHFRLGHLSFRAVQSILRSKALGNSGLDRAASKCIAPKCASCQFGKGKRRPTESKLSKMRTEKDGALKAEHLQPGEKVSVDHFVCTTKGRLYTSQGKTKEDRMYTGGCIFVDHASGYIHVEHQVCLNSHETLVSKHRFEQAAYNQGVGVQEYHADNGIFAKGAFDEDLRHFRQHIKLAGVGAHHHNGVAERAISTIMAMARTMLLHHAIRWPDTADMGMWPMAVDYATYIYNHVPNPDTGVAPIDVFTRTRAPRTQLQNLHVFGCPTYVLDPTLQDGKKIPRWQPRSRRSIFVGLSRQHASTIPLVVNNRTLGISPQFHSVFDDWFSTVIQDADARTDGPPDSWFNLFTDSRFQYSFDEGDSTQLTDEWLDEAELTYRRSKEREESIKRRVETTFPPDSEIEHVQPEPQDTNERAPTVTTPTVTFAPTLTEEKEQPRPQKATGTSHPPAEGGKEKRKRPARVSKPAQPQPLRRSSRLQGLNPQGEPVRADFQAHFAEMHKSGFLSEHVDQEFLARSAPEIFAYTAEYGAYAVSKSDPDTLMYHEAMADCDRLQWLASMDAEIDELQQMDTWIVVERSAVPMGVRVTPSTWTFKRKRFPDGRLMKHKGRFLVRGDLQVLGENVSETYSPVVAWSTIRTVLTLSMTLGLKTRCVDFKNAFVHAQLDLSEQRYLEPPKGYRDKNGRDVVLHLQRSLYGSRDAPRKFYDCLSESMINLGFVKSELDPCLFIRKDMLFISWVDDGIFVSNNSEAIQEVITALEVQEKFKVKDEGELANYLGIQFTPNSDGGLEATQGGLIDKIMGASNMEDCKPSRTPATQLPLSRDEEGEPFDDSFNYASVVGMLQYLQGNTRPDITYAVSQVARFSYNPKASHGRAVKHIIKYLQGTRSRGLIYKPKGELSIDCYCDADFAGMYGHETPHDPISVKSRTGYIITLAGCPLIWKSKLQTQIALSTTESEYLSLSESMRELLPLRELMIELSTAMKLDKKIKVVTKSTVFEDNNGCLVLAQSPRMTPRNRHIAVPMHHFRSRVHDGSVSIEKIDTKVQLGDLFTKGVDIETFERLRKLIMGW
jgi:hypothetical protein